ncbi:MAG: glycine--tRNA ligase subunit beta [Bryobacterales bacterium]|nr:glycine--tRNA ligase subunit beta [Bryobacterales bacterium]MBV9401169.1 glycine--tRNA ligase subunit beta [Bryobacterales bacterium]
MIPRAVEDIPATGSPWTGAQVEATPRRLVVLADLPERQADDVFEHQGPPVSAGQNAVQGFAKKYGVSVDQLRQVETAKGPYFQYREVVPGRPFIEVLVELIPDLIRNIYWPKTMYWTGGKAGPRFIRPIRWIVALLGGDVIPFEIAGVKSGNLTQGHRILGSSSIPVTTANYESELRKNFVILSAHQRREKIVTEAVQLGAKIDPDLLETLTYTTEYPTAIRGDFDRGYLELPAEVLTTVMKHHQKYFAVESGPGVLAPHFVAVMNTSGDPEGLVKKGNERVLRARFNDARFFWDVDQQKKLADRIEDLAHVTFQAKLGSYKEKTERVAALVKELGGNEHAQRAALLCKCDLTTEMVKEFTDLQGIVGGLYAKAQGEAEPVWRAIYEHYQPVSMEDSIPATAEGQIVALADKLDTLRGCFAVGLAPTGSKDPFALRRAAQGVVKILAEARLEYRLDELFSGALREFLLERMQYYFREVRGYKYDEVNAVFAAGTGTLADVQDRLAALAAIRPTENFEPLAASCKRIRNILKQAEFHANGAAVKSELLEAGPERDLADRLSGFVRAGETDYFKRLVAIATFRPQVDLFFDKVLVNAQDPNVRTNRLTLLSTLLREFSTIADFSEIVTSGDMK